MSTSATGMTLVEVLVGLAVGLVVAAATQALIAGAGHAWRRADASAESSAALANAADQITRDVRLAGFDPSGAGITAIVAATAQSLELGADLDGSGAVDADSEEHVTYRCSNGCETVQRVVGRQSLPLVSGLASSGFRLRYFDQHGIELTPADAARRTAVRAVSVTLTNMATRDVAGRQLASGARILSR